MRLIKGLLGGIGIGLAVAAAIFVLAMALDLVACFFTCGTMACFSYNSCSSQIWDEIWDDFDGVLILGGFCGIAGAIIGIIYGIARWIQDGIAKSNERKKQLEKTAKEAINAVFSAKDLIDKIKSTITSALKSKYISTKAVELLNEADAVANKSTSLLEKAVSLAEKADKKLKKKAMRSRKKALEISQKAKVFAEAIVADAEEARNLYDQANGEDIKLARIRNIANASVKEANNAIKLALKSAERADKKSITSSKAKETANKAIDVAKEAIMLGEDISKLAAEITSATTENDAQSRNAQFSELIVSANERVSDVNSLADQAIKEENDLVQLQKEANDVAEKATKAIEKSTLEIEANKESTYITEIARKSVADAEFSAKSTAKAAEETMKWVGEAKTATTSHEAQSAVSQAKETVKIAIKESELIVELFIEAANEESKYLQAEKEVSEAVNLVKDILANAIALFNETLEMAHISVKAEEASEKSCVAIHKAKELIAEIEKCLSGIKTTDSVQVAQSMATQANELISKVETEGEKVDAAHKVAINEKDESHRNELASQGTPKEKYDNAVWYLKKEDMEQYLVWLTQSAESGYASAQKELGGRLAPKDIHTAIKWFEMAAEQGDIDCQFDIGYLYLYEENVKDEEKAFHWLEKASTSGHSSAYCHLYVNDKLSHSIDKIIKVLKNAADNEKNPIAMLCIGEIYCLGKWVDRNYPLGVSYLRSGISRCNECIPPNFFFRIGKMVFTENDYESAIPFFEKASINGDSLALQAKECLDKAKKILSEQKEEDQRLKEIKKIDGDIDRVRNEINDLSEEVYKEQGYLRKFQIDYEDASSNYRSAIMYNQLGANSYEATMAKVSRDSALDACSRSSQKIEKLEDKLKVSEKRLNDLEKRRRELSKSLSVKQNKKNEIFNW